MGNVVDAIPFKGECCFHLSQLTQTLGEKIHLLQTPEPISSWHRHISVTPDSCKLLSQLATSAAA